MPRMELKFRTILNKPLAELGMRNSFISGVADFSGITDYDALYIGKVIQATYINVDEEGTEAAAVTAAFELTSAGPDPNILPFNMNRPFAFVIRASGERFEWKCRLICFLQMRYVRRRLYRPFAVEIRSGALSWSNHRDGTASFRLWWIPTPARLRQEFRSRKWNAAMVR